MAIAVEPLTARLQITDALPVLIAGVVLMTMALPSRTLAQGA